jgi:hypothetical protein
MAVAHAAGQEPPVIEDESKVPPYTLPEPLMLANGKAVTDSESWRDRRAEIKSLFETNVYGKMPGPAKVLAFRTTSTDSNALGGKATRKEVTVAFSKDPNAPGIDLLIYIPNTGKGPYPTFLALNFYGNHATQPDPAITLSTRWMRADPTKGIVDHKATEKSRGVDSGSWPVERMIDRGYALVTAYYGDIDPDYDDGFQNGVHPLFYEEGQTRPKPDECGSIGAWAWGLSRALDYLETEPSFDAKRVGLMGHSRLGKTALWAGACDPRFAIVISNQSGEGGAALTRRRFGETILRINNSFPHWFCENFKRYNDHEDDLPVDQHMLIALIAPRPVLVCSAAEDLWADPRGEFLAAKAADPVYRLLGTDGLGARQMPAPNQLVNTTIGYHIRPGKHGVLPADWEVYLDFADAHLKPTKP